MAHARKMKERVVKALEALEESSTAGIHEWMKNHYAWPPTITQLGNILSKHQEFEKAGFINKTTLGGRTRQTIWRLSE